MLYNTSLLLTCFIHVVVVKLLSHAQLFPTPPTIGYQGPLSVVLFRQEYWGGLPWVLPPGYLTDPGIEHASPCNAGDLGSIPGLGRSPGGEHGNPLQYSCLENPHGQRSLLGYLQPMGLQKVGHD